jgi:hypothetical protein
MKRNLTLILCFVVLSVTGCSIVRQPSPEEYESVRQNKKAIVLFRLTGSLDGKEVNLIRETSVAQDQFNYSILSFGLANMDAGEPVKAFPVGFGVAPWLRSYTYFSPSPENAENGWGAFLLDPGTYYLRITSHVKGVMEPVPQFSFTVPPNTPLVYIGSLHVGCTTIENAGWFGGRGFGYGSCSSDAPVANEEGAAKQVAQASFGDFGSLSTMIIQRFDRAPLPPGTISTAAPLGLSVPRGKIDVGSPEWMKRAVGLGLLPSGVLLGLLSGGGGGGPGAGGAVLLALAWAPVGATLGYLGGKWSESSWEPCQKALQESLTKFDPMAVLATKIKSALEHEEVQTLDIGTGDDAGGGALASEVKSILNAKIARVVLRFCSPTLCLDVATHATLFDVATQTYVYDRVFVYSSGDASKRELQPYESFVGGSTSLVLGRELEAYCGEGGGEILHGDISNALDATVNQIVQDLGLKVQ